MDAYINWHAENSKKHQDSKIVSLKDSLQKADKKSKIQHVPKRKEKG